VSLNAASRLWLNREERLSLPAPVGATRASAPPSDFEGFIEACDRATVAGEVERLFIATARVIGMDKVALTTHAPPTHLGRFGVCVHNWERTAIAHLYASSLERANPLFEHAETSEAPIFWNDAAFRSRLDAEQRAWMDQLAALGLRDGISQRVRTAIAPASCSMTPAWNAPDPFAVRQVMRMASYAFNTIVALRRPKGASDPLTRRERQCLSLAVFSGLRPREVAETLGVSINTVRSIRQSASARLGARSQEETVWRLMESGQLFHRGGFSRPRNR
jgi:DNA-binding CsgD family transcriptional regulator